MQIKTDVEERSQCAGAVGRALVGTALAIIVFICAASATATPATAQALPAGLDAPPDRPPGSLTLAARTLTVESGSEVELEAGWFVVPARRREITGALEARGGATGRIQLPVYRLLSTAEAAGTPIFLLAGGPGSSWIDNFQNEQNFREVQFYRTIGDVVLFDQRGGGHSKPELTCDQHADLPLDEPLTETAMAAEFERMSIACRDRWLAAGIDLAAYNTRENAADVNALREAFGYDEITLVGGSYGSHLALALMRDYRETVDRVILHGVEGPDHTYDDPGGRLRTLERIAATAEASPELGPDIPAGGLLAALGEVIERLEDQPDVVEIPGEDVSVVIDATLVRQIAAFQAGRRSRPNVWPEFILDLHAGDYSFAARGALAFRRRPLDDPMHYMMDCSSGITPARAARYDSDPAVKLLGDGNLEYAGACPAWKASDPGEGFRAPVVSDIPTLIVHGTWDTSTPIENAREVAATLSDVRLVEVVGGTHGALYNLYERWEPARERIGDFLRGGDLDFPATVMLSPVEYLPRNHRDLP